MIRYETLKRFCADDEIRLAMRYVKKVEGKWYATDGAVLCRVDETTRHPDDILYDVDEFPADTKYPNVLSVVPQTIGEDAVSIPVGEISDKISKVRQIKEMKDVEEEIHYKKCDCNDCYGGQVTLTESISYNGHHYNIEEEVDCPVCHGYGVIPDFDDYDPDEDDYDPETDKTCIVSKWTGKMIPDPDGPVEIIGMNVKAKYLQLVVDVAREMSTDTIHADRIGDMLVVDVKGVMICIMRLLTE